MGRTAVARPDRRRVHAMSAVRSRLALALMCSLAACSGSSGPAKPRFERRHGGAARLDSARLPLPVESEQQRARAVRRLRVSGAESSGRDVVVQRALCQRSREPAALLSLSDPSSSAPGEEVERLLGQVAEVGDSVPVGRESILRGLPPDSLLVERASRSRVRKSSSALRCSSRR